MGLRKLRMEKPWGGRENLIYTVNQNQNKPDLLAIYISGQITIIPKPELRRFLRIPLLNHHLG